VPVVLRRLRAPLAVRGVLVPAGGNVAVATSLLHARPELYEAPGRFEPERFLARRYGPFEHAPFGGGHRRCLGAAFAAYELRVVLGTLLANARFRHVAGRPPRPILAGITASASRKIRLVRAA
jgi:cytochrome P450